MSSRFNPVTLFRSRSKSKSRSESLQSRSSRDDSHDSRTDTRRHTLRSYFSRKSSEKSPPTRSSRPRLRRILTSFRRNPSSQSRNDTKRAESVPPIEQTNKKVIPLGRSSPTHEEPRIPSTKELATPPPLAQFDSSDLSDVERELNTLAQSRQQIEERFFPTCRTDQATIENDQSFDLGETQVSKTPENSSDLQSSDLSTEREEEVSVEDEGKYVEEESDEFEGKYQYETDYPIIEQSDSLASLPETVLPEDWSVGKDSSPSEVSEDENEFTPKSSCNSSNADLVQEDQYKEEIVADDTGWKPLEYDADTEKDLEQTDGNIDYLQNDVFNNENQSMYSYQNTSSSWAQPDLGVSQDFAQDASKLSWPYAPHTETDDYGLNTPAIIVTSASTGSLNRWDEPNGHTELPSRPPPPAPTAPPRPPSPAPPRPPPAVRQTGSDAESATQAKKKKKLFGLVDLGPLPSDPDPNFPFRKHLEKSIVPNPRKALQRIIRGETKAERRQRKEKEEFAKLLKGPKTTQPELIETHSKEWEEFQALKEAIEEKVQITAFKVTFGSPTKDVFAGDDKEDEQQTEGWADFDSAFNQTEEKLVGISNPWDQSEVVPDQFEAQFETQFSDRQNVETTPIEDSWISEADQSDTEVDAPEITFEDPWKTQNCEDVHDDFFAFDEQNTSLHKEVFPTAFENNHISVEASAEEPYNFFFGDPETSETNFSDQISTEPIVAIPTKVTMYQTKRDRTSIDLMKGIDDILGGGSGEFTSNPSVPASESTEVVHHFGSSDQMNPVADVGFETMQQPETPEANREESPVITSSPSAPVSESTEPMHYSASGDHSILLSDFGFEHTQPLESTQPMVRTPVESSSESIVAQELNPTEDPNYFELKQPEPDDNVTDEHEVDEDHVNIDYAVLDAPEQEVMMEASDIDDALHADDVLWGGCSEVKATQPLEDIKSSHFDETSPSNELVTLTTNEFDPSHVRPRNKPVRQGTLSGNNPFRAAVDGGIESEEELFKAAASIELVNAQVKRSKHHDSFESSENSVDEPTPEVESQVSNNEGLEDVVSELPEAGFDPLQTIYPESDNESGPGGSQNHGLITLEIKEKSAVEMNENQNEVPIIKGPPRPPTPPVDLLTEDVDFREKPDETEMPKKAVPAGWVDFSENSEFLTDDERPVLSADQAFDVDWTAALGKPEPQVPEPPRPDTPDPELDIPFFPPVEDGEFYRLWLRFPEKKTRVKQVSKYTTDRYWREVALCFSEEHGRKVINLYEVDEKSDQISSEPYRSIRIEPYMQLSREKLQQYDKYGKLHVFKLNHVSYREMVGIRPEKFPLKNLQKLVTHKPKQNVTVDHLPVYSEILKFGSLDQNKIRKLMPVFEDALMKIPAHKDTTLSYNREEVCCYVVDEYHGSLSAKSTVISQKARTRILCTAFVNGGPHIILGLNDKWRYGREVVRRSDILPVMHDEWISIRNPEFHSCVEMDAYEKDHMLKFYPLDGCRFELLRFRVSLRDNPDLPMFVKIIYSIDGRRVSMRCELRVPGFFSPSQRKGAVPCENVEIHIPVPEEWIYHFRVEKHHKYGSVHSTLRKPGKIKGLERITQMAQSLLPPSILEASIGVAKYEHLYKAIVWRIPRIPGKGEASMRPHLLSCKLTLAPHDEVPTWDSLVRESQVEFTMPSSTVSGATVRSISVEHTGVAEKFVKYTSKYRYTVQIDYQLGERKQPALKGLLDEDAEKEEPAPVTQSAEETNQDVVEQGQPNDGIADLLGLDDDFNATEPGGNEYEPVDNNPGGMDDLL